MSFSSEVKRRTFRADCKRAALPSGRDCSDLKSVRKDRTLQKMTDTV